MSDASHVPAPSFNSLRTRNLDFAEHEAAGPSPLYAELSRAVAAFGTLLCFISSLPPHKQQPNLVIAPSGTSTVHRLVRSTSPSSWALTRRRYHAAMHVVQASADRRIRCRFSPPAYAPTPRALCFRVAAYCELHHPHRSRSRRPCLRSALFASPFSRFCSPPAHLHHPLRHRRRSR